MPSGDRVGAVRMRDGVAAAVHEQDPNTYLRYFDHREGGKSFRKNIRLKSQCCGPGDSSPPPQHRRVRLGQRVRLFPLAGRQFPGKLADFIQILFAIRITPLSSRYAKGPDTLGLDFRSCQVVQIANKAELIRFDNRLTNDKQSPIGLFRFRVSPRSYCGTSLSSTNRPY